MSPHLVTVIVATVAAASKRTNSRRRREARRHGIGLFAWIRRWRRRVGRRDAPATRRPAWSERHLRRVE